MRNALSSDSSKCVLFCECFSLGGEPTVVGNPKSHHSEHWFLYVDCAWGDAKIWGIAQRKTSNLYNVSFTEQTSVQSGQLVAAAYV